MPKAKKVTKEWKPKVRLQSRSNVKNKNSQHYGPNWLREIGYKPTQRRGVRVAEFDLAKCLSLDLHGYSRYLKKMTGSSIEGPPLDPTPTFSYSVFGAVLASAFSKKTLKEEGAVDKEEKEFNFVAAAPEPLPLADLFQAVPPIASSVMGGMRDVRWGTDASQVGKIEVMEDLDAARIAAIKLLLEYKFIRLQPEEYALAEQVGIIDPTESKIAEIEI